MVDKLLTWYCFCLERYWRQWFGMEFEIWPEGVRGRGQQGLLQRSRWEDSYPCRFPWLRVRGEIGIRVIKRRNWGKKWCKRRDITCWSEALNIPRTRRYLYLTNENEDAQCYTDCSLSASRYRSGDDLWRYRAHLRPPSQEGTFLENPLEASKEGISSPVQIWWDDGD